MPVISCRWTLLFRCEGLEQNAGQKVPEGSNVPALSCVTLTDGWFWKQRDADGHQSGDDDRG